MIDEIMDFNMDSHNEPIIKIIGVGGGGSNAVEYMFKKGISNVEFVVCNTDSMALEACSVPTKIQLGITLSQGNGAGNNPLNGEQAAIENLDDVIDSFTENTKMIFLTAGMGGGTGTGATPVIAKAAKEKGILTVAIVTIPFRFEGPQRIKQAVDGISRLSEYVDSLLVIDNEKLKEKHGDLELTNAFAKADDIVADAAQGISELITLPGYVNVDFEDVKTVMKDSGVAVMGAAKANGENRAIEAIKQALDSPLLDNNHIIGAKEILLNIVSGVEDDEISMDEVTSITDHVLLQVGGEAQVIWGVGTNSSLDGDISVTIVATGFEAKTIEEIIDEPYLKNIAKPKTLITQPQDSPVKEDKPTRENEEEPNPCNYDKNKLVPNNFTQTSDVVNYRGDISDDDKLESIKKCEEEDSNRVEGLQKNIEDNNSISSEIELPKKKVEKISGINNTKEAGFIDRDFNKFEYSKSEVPIHEKVNENNKEEIAIGFENETQVSVNENNTHDDVQKSEKDMDSDTIKRYPKVVNVYYGEVIMKPEMSESQIRKIEIQPAYKRRKAIN